MSNCILPSPYKAQGTDDEQRNLEESIKRLRQCTSEVEANLLALEKVGII